MAHLERCILVRTDKKAISKTGDKPAVVIETTESQVQYAMRSSYNGLIIIAENFDEREKIMTKADINQDFANKVIDDEERRLMS